VKAPGEGNFCALFMGPGSCAAPVVPAVLRRDTNPQPPWDGFLVGVKLGERPFWSKVTDVLAYVSMSAT